MDKKTDKYKKSVEDMQTFIKKINTHTYKPKASINEIYDELVDGLNIILENTLDG